MRFYACITCATCWQIGGPTEELHSTWMMIESQGLLHCPTPKCGGNLMRVKGLVNDPRFKVKEIPLPIFFRAVNGFGSPDGTAATVKRFRELITTKKVSEVIADPTGQPERVIVKRLVLEDGTTLHFDSSAKGACCYYIEEPGPSCLEVLENELAGEGPDSNREEAGRASETDSPDGSTARDGGTAEAAAAEQPITGSVPAVPATGDVPEPSRPADGTHGPGADVRV